MYATALAKLHANKPCTTSEHTNMELQCVFSVRNYLIIIEKIIWSKYGPVARSRLMWESQWISQCSQQKSTQCWSCEKRSEESIAPGNIEHLQDTSYSNKRWKMITAARIRKSTILESAKRTLSNHGNQITEMSKSQSHRRMDLKKYIHDGQMCSKINLGVLSNKTIHGENNEKIFNFQCSF